MPRRGRLRAVAPARPPPLGPPASPRGAAEMNPKASRRRARRPALAGHLPPGLAPAGRDLGAHRREPAAAVLVAGQPPPGGLPRPCLHDLGVVQGAGRRGPAAAGWFTLTRVGPEHPHGRPAAAVHQEDGPPLPPGPRPPHGGGRRCGGARSGGWAGRRTLALAVAATRLGRSFEAEDFWITVVHFLGESTRARPRPCRPDRGLSASPEVRPPGWTHRGGRTGGPGSAATGPLDERPHAEVAPPAGRRLSRAVEAMQKRSIH